MQVVPVYFHAFDFTYTILAIVMAIESNRLKTTDFQQTIYPLQGK